MVYGVVGYWSVMDCSLNLPSLVRSRCHLIDVLSSTSVSPPFRLLSIALLSSHTPQVTHTGADQDVMDSCMDMDGCVSDAVRADLAPHTISIQGCVSGDLPLSPLTHSPSSRSTHDHIHISIPSIMHHSPSIHPILIDHPVSPV